MAGRGLTSARGAAPTEEMRHRLSDLTTPENTHTVQIGSAIGTHVGPGAPNGRLLGAGDLHLVSRAVFGSLAMAVPHETICIMTLARTAASINKAEAVGKARGQIGFADALRGVFPMWVPALPNLVAGSVRRLDASECR